VSPSSCAKDAIDIVGVTGSLDRRRWRGRGTEEEAARIGEGAAEAEGESEAYPEEAYADEAYADESALHGLP